VGGIAKPIKYTLTIYIDRYGENPYDKPRRCKNASNKPQDRVVATDTRRMPRIQLTYYTYKLYFAWTRCTDVTGIEGLRDVSRVLVRPPVYINASPPCVSSRCAVHIHVSPYVHDVPRSSCSFACVPPPPSPPSLLS